MDNFIHFIKKLKKLIKIEKINFYIFSLTFLGHLRVPIQLRVCHQELPIAAHLDAVESLDLRGLSRPFPDTANVLHQSPRHDPLLHLSGPHDVFLPSGGGVFRGPSGQSVYWDAAPSAGTLFTVPSSVKNETLHHVPLHHDIFPRFLHRKKIAGYFFIPFYYSFFSL